MNMLQNNTVEAGSAANPDGLSFKEFIMANMRTVPGRGHKKTITSAELAETLGLSTKVFQEILNGRRGGPDRRDFIIALCAELGLDVEETQEALKLYPDYVRQLAEDDPRDVEIIRFLNADFDTLINCRELNEHLHSHNLPELKIRHHNPIQPVTRRKNNMENRRINWSLRSEAERQRYNFYTSLNYDDPTSTVLSLFTYGDTHIPNFSIKEVYKAFLDEQPYPPREEMELDFDLPLEAPVGFANFEVPSACIDDSFEAFGDALPDSAPMPLSQMGLQFAEETAPTIPARRSYHARRNLGSTQHLLKCISAPEPGFAFETDEYNPLEEKDFRTVAHHHTSTFRMTTNTASAGILLNQLRSRRRISKDMIRIEELLNYFRYQQEKPKDEMFRISTELRSRENGNKLLYINVQGKEAQKGKQNIVLLLDVSGSMCDNAVQTQAAIAAIVSRLKRGDTFSLVTYSNRDRVVIDGLKIASDEDRIAILERVLELEIAGGTYGSAGIEKAYEIGKRNCIPDGNNQVILITDGDLNFGITDAGGLEALIEEKKRDHLFLSVLGTGLDNYKDNKLEVLAKHGNGVYRVINNLSDVKKSIRDEYASLTQIIAKDVKAQVEFNPEIVKSFRLLGFENRELAHEDFTNDKVISEPFGSGGYGVALYELVMADGIAETASDLRYTRISTTGSDELGTVKVRYKEPLEDTSHEIEHIIPNSEDHFTDNLLLAYVVYVCAEKLRDSDRISAHDEAAAQLAIEKLGPAIRAMNIDDLDKLREILYRSREQLRVGRHSDSDYPW